MTAAAVALTKALSGLAQVATLRPVLGKLLRRSRDFAKLDDETCDRFYAEFLRAPAWLLAQAADEQLHSRLAPAESLRRCAVLVSEDDAFYPARLLEPYLTAHGIPREFIQRLADCGHYPQLEESDHPEAKAHNVEQITRCVDLMLTASREGAPLSTMMASTELGESAA
jgi:pimeloyl-ACP methyl ester carboxylesterase